MTMMMPETSRCNFAELLPTEILIEILIRLPLESVLACMKVCKSWNHLILQPFFTDLHRSSARRRLTIMAVHSLPHRTRGVRTAFGFITENTTTRRLTYHDTGTVIHHHIPDMKIVGSCNGLICLPSVERYFNFQTCSPVYYYTLLVWNPILKTYLYLPEPPKPPGFVYDFNTQVGFGYVPSTGQYKAVNLVYVDDGRRLLFHVCTIQSSRNNSNKMIPPPRASAWRTFAYVCGGICNFVSHPTFHNGSVVWIAQEYNVPYGQSLICFDIEKEEMRALTLPPTIFRHDDMTFKRRFDEVVRIGVYYDDDGDSHLYVCEELPTRANIWVMEDCKRVDSLKRKWVIPLPRVGRRRVPIKLFNVDKDGRVLLRVKDSTLAYYDPNKNVVETIENVQLPIRSCLVVDMPNFLGCMF